ncbi:MAG: hypothetical protein GXP25_08735 [Planctomycetes bacterium]|nr:hypothetical protein [Planctomycetota bacterium]
MLNEWTDEERQILETKVRTAQIVYIATCASIAFYLIVGYAIAAANHPFSGFAQAGEGDSLITILRYVLWAIALGVTLPFVLMVRWLLWKQVTAAGEPPSANEYGNFFLRYSIITSAISEAPAIYGLLLFLLAGSWLDLIGLGVLATIYKSLFIPTLGKAMEWAHVLETELGSRS